MLQVSYKIETLRADMYVTSSDKVRLAMEIILIVWITYMVTMEGKGLYLVRRLLMFVTKRPSSINMTEKLLNSSPL